MQEEWLAWFHFAVIILVLVTFLFGKLYYQSFFLATQKKLKNATGCGTGYVTGRK